MVTWHAPKEKNEDFRTRLHRNGRRMTPQREAILTVLKASRLHPTAEEIYGEVQRRIPKISLGTVYRNLQVLVEEGYALRLPSRTGSHRFDGDVSSHHHVACRGCGRIADVFLPEDTALAQAVTQQTGYRLSGWRTDFEGICPDCG